MPLNSFSGCVEEKLLTYSKADKEFIVSTLNADQLSRQQGKLRSSGSDVRISTPNTWNQENNSNSEETYFRNSGPYHINSVSIISNRY